MNVVLVSHCARAAQRYQTFLGTSAISQARSVWLSHRILSSTEIFLCILGAVRESALPPSLALTGKIPDKVGTLEGETTLGKSRPSSVVVWNLSNFTLVSLEQIQDWREPIPSRDLPKLLYSSPPPHWQGMKVSMGVVKGHLRQGLFDSSDSLVARYSLYLSGSDFHVASVNFQPFC
jgi:hypothetical protein